MNSIQCDIALRNFNKYEDKLKQLSFVRDKYNAELGYTNTSNHLYRINVNNRPKFIEYMRDNGISCGIHYEAAHLNPVYMIDGSSCPNSESASMTTVSIPFHEKLTDTEINYVIAKIKQYGNN